MSYLTGATNAQSLNGILTITDGVITISEGTISGLEEIDLNDLQVADTAIIENLVVNNQIDMTSGQIKNVSAPTDNGDAVNKQYVDTNFLNKTTTTTQIVNSNLDMNTKRIYNLSDPATQTDAVNLSYLSTNYLNKTTTLNQTIAGKVQFNNATTDIVSNPVINMFNTIGGSDDGMFLRFQKGVVQTSNTQIGGISACDKNDGNTIIRVADLIFSRGTSGEARMDLKVINGNRNPLTITDGAFTSRNNNHKFLKQDLTDLLNYTTATDKWIMYKPLDMNTSNKIINLAEPTLAQDASTKNYVDTHSNNGNYLLRDGTLAMTGNLQMGSYKITNLLEPGDLNDAANKYYVDTQTANTHYLLRNGSLAMTGNLNLATHNLITTGDINCNDITSDGNINTTADMSCADFNSAGNQVIGGSSVNVLDVKSSAFFEANVLIETNKHLAFNSGTLSTTNGMLMNYDGGVGFLDMRGTEFRIRTAEAGVPNNIRFKVNDTNTTIRNNLFCDANCTFGNEDTDTATFNCKTTIHNTLTFATGSRIDGARVRLIKSGNISYTMSNASVENGVLCNNTSTISITMPAKHAYWNNRSYYVKIKTATVNLVMNTDTRIDNDESTLVMSSDYRGYLLHFDSDYENNGDIWRLCQI